MSHLDCREWLLTNGLGSFASGTVCDARTRTYHGWLIAALEPPDRCTLLLSHIEASLEISGTTFALGTNFWVGGEVGPQGYEWLQSFTVDPVPTWTWQGQTWQLTRQIVMPQSHPWVTAPLGYWASPEAVGQPQIASLTTFGAPVTGPLAVPADALIRQQVLIQYSYWGSGPAMLRLRPLIGDRDFHQLQHQSSELQFSQLISPQHLLLQSVRPGQAGTPWQLRWSKGLYQPDGVWYWRYHYPVEAERGLRDTEDLYSPGYLSLLLQPGESLTLEASVGGNADLSPLDDTPFEHALQAVKSPPALPPSVRSGRIPLPLAQLLNAGDRFLAWRTSSGSPTIIAGYPWMRDLGRFTLMAIPGLTFATQRFELARKMLAAIGRQCHHGLMPNGFGAEGNQPIYNSLDTSLWWIETLGLYLHATQDWDFLREQYPTVKRIYKALTIGTLHNIRIDASDGLIIWEDPRRALTWMDAMIDGQPVTPRQGKPIEVNALWYSALCWASKWAQWLGKDDPNPALPNQARRYESQAEQVKQSLQRFWYTDAGYLFDLITPDDRCDRAIRPNAVLALSLAHCAFSPSQARSILQVARDRLLTPYGLRTLDPQDPAYIGRYEGTPWERELASHQGTVWSWLLGPFWRAWQRFDPAPLAFDWQPLVDHFEQQGCLGEISELFDGDFPHEPRGAIASACTIAELLRLELVKI
jgi:predicted glycogen debranching enzyme